MAEAIIKLSNRCSNIDIQMGKKKFTSLLLLLPMLCCQPASKAKWQNYFNNNQVQEIEVAVYSNSILVPLTIGGKVWNFLLDTGSPTFISPNLSKELKLQTFNDSISALDYYGNSRKIATTIIPELTLSNTKYKNIKASITRPIQNFKPCDREIDGYLGSDFFAEKVLQIDIKNQMIRISNSIDKFDLKEHRASSFDFLSEKQNTPLIYIYYPGGKAVEQVMFDTGSNNYFYRMRKSTLTQLLEADILTPSHIVDSLDHTANGAGAFGKQKDSINFQLELDTIEFIGTKITNCPGTTFNGGIKSVAGAPFLNLGIVTLDYKNRKFYFRPYCKEPIDLAPPFGMHLKHQNNRFVVHRIRPNSTAEINGIKQGYVLDEVNAIKLDSLSICDLIKREWTAELRKDTVHLKFLNSVNSTIEITLLNNDHSTASADS